MFAILSVCLPACPSGCHPIWTSASLSCLPPWLNVLQTVQVFAILFEHLPACPSVCHHVWTSVSLSDEPLPACLNIYPGYECLLSRMSVSISERRPNVRPSVNTSYMSGIYSKGWTAFLNVCCLSEPLLVFWIGGKNKCCGSGSLCFWVPRIWIRHYMFGSGSFHQQAKK